MFTFGEEKGSDLEGTWENFWGICNVLFLDLGYDFTDIFALG